KEPLFTVMVPDAAQASAPEAAPAPFALARDPDPVCEEDEEDAEDARRDDAPATQTGHRQDEENSLQIPADVVEEFGEARARRDATHALAAEVKAKLGIAPDPAPDPAAATRTGPGQDRKAIVLTDEMKTFIVKGLARYETPSRVAASVQAEFGVAIDRRQVFA